MACNEKSTEGTSQVTPKNEDFGTFLKFGDLDSSIRIKPGNIHPTAPTVSSPQNTTEKITCDDTQEPDSSAEHTSPELPHSGPSLECSLESLPLSSTTPRSEDTIEDQSQRNILFEDHAFIPITPICVAKDEHGGYCSREAFESCPDCLLTTYCSSECRESHLSIHKKACPKYVKYQEIYDLSTLQDSCMEVRWPFWAKTAAIDVLNLTKNEGKFFDGVLDILLTGQSCLRNLVYTIAKLPETANPLLRFSLNEIGSASAIRAALSILLLIDRHDDVLNAEALVHLWYSARMTPALWQHIWAIAVTELLRAATFARVDHPLALAQDKEKPREVMLRRGQNAVSCVFTVDIWAAIEKFCQEDVSFASVDSHALRLMDAENILPVSFVVARVTPSRAAGYVKWLDDGLLIPFDHPRDGYTVLNPILFYEGKFAPGALAEPLREWPMEFFDYQVGPAKNDVFGHAFYYIRNLLVEVQQRMRTLETQFSAMLAPFTDVVGHMPFQGSDLKPRFDRVDAGDLLDEIPMCVIAVLGDLLKHTDENPHAALLTLSRQTVGHNLDLVTADLVKEQTFVNSKLGTKLDELAPPLGPDTKNYARALVQRRAGLLMWRNWDRFSEIYLDNPQHVYAVVSECIKDGNTSESGMRATSFMGLSLQAKNAITTRWPRRLVHSVKESPSQEDFFRYLSCTNSNPERWLEWKKKKDVDPAVEASCRLHAARESEWTFIELEFLGRLVTEPYQKIIKLLYKDVTASMERAAQEQKDAAEALVSAANAAQDGDKGGEGEGEGECEGEDGEEAKAKAKKKKSGKKAKKRAKR